MQELGGEVYRKFNKDDISFQIFLVAGEMRGGGVGMGQGTKGEDERGGGGTRRKDIGHTDVIFFLSLVMSTEDNTSLHIHKKCL